MVRTLTICGQEGVSHVHVGESLGHAARYLPGRQVVILTDQNVLRLYGKNFPAGEVIAMDAGEQAKTLETANQIYGRLLGLEADRSWFLLGIGGGVVCDVAGFVASTYLRGIRFGFVSTTLLSQADASVGGKNGVNYRGYKNVVGLIHQPELVICDPDVLSTLPRREVLSGLAEIVKHALIGDEALFRYLEEKWEKALRLERPVIERLLSDSLSVKVAVVNADERERGERRKLNFGHTFGHAIEKTTGISHGEAVSLGMVLASRLSREKLGLASEDLERVLGLLQRIGLPTECGLDKDGMMEALRKDKKRASGKIGFVLLRSIGHAVVEDTEIEELGNLLEKQSTLAGGEPPQ